jgi:hypothetical protein
VEQFERIRRESRDEGVSVRALAARHGVHRRTVRAALGDATPPPRKVPARVRPVLGAWEDVVREWLIKDKDVPRKQRHTARRVWEPLVEERGARGLGSTGTLLANSQTRPGAQSFEDQVSW